MRDRQFTFWDWFYAAADLIRKHLLGPWQAKLILGFVSKQQVQEELIKCEVGTFILRFSDSAIGGITIAWVGEDEKVGQELSLLLHNGPPRTCSREDTDGGAPALP